MNALPVGLERIADARSRSGYFEDLQKRGFDVAFTTFRADVYSTAVERFRQAYLDFAGQAAQLGYPVCIRIPTTVCTSSELGIEEAQYDTANKPVMAGSEAFAASPASQAWREHVRDLVVLFSRDLGYDWVVIEEPEFLVDVPGTSDRLSAFFAEQYPEARYPASSEENPEYLLCQQAKADAVREFCLSLAAEAKAAGAKKVGIVPHLLLPAAQAKADGIPRTACDQGHFAQSDDVDFLVSDMEPGRVFFGEVIPGGEPSKSPIACHVESRAQSSGKPLITAAGGVDGFKEPVPVCFRKDALLSALAAGSSGFTGQDWEADPVEDDGYAALLSEAASYAGRLGQPYSPVAFVFSDSGGRHAAPNDYETVFRHYWALAKGMAEDAHLPMLTFHAETLQGSLMEHPEVRVLVFEEHFPLTVDQMLVIRDWWQGPEKRAIVAFASGLGLSADPELPGSRPCTRALPGVLELIGLRQDPDEPVYSFEKPMKLRDVSRVRRSAIFQDYPDLTLDRVANVRRVFGSRATVLYEADLDEPKIPVVSEWKDRTTLAIFCGFGLEERNSRAAQLAVRYALKETDSSITIIGDCSDGLLWNINRNGYIVISNVSDNRGTAIGRPGRSQFWDCKAQEMVPEGEPQFTIAPHSFALYRVVGRRSKFFDIRGVSYLRSLVDGAGRADIDVVAGRSTTLVLRASPKEIAVDGKACTITQQVINGAYHVTLQQCAPGDRRISLKW